MRTKLRALFRGGLIGAFVKLVIFVVITVILSSVLATIGLDWALLFLAGMGLLGVLASARLPEVSRG